MLDNVSDRKARYCIDEHPDVNDANSFAGYFELKVCADGEGATAQSNLNEEYFVCFITRALQTLKGFQNDGTDESQRLVRARDDCVAKLRKDAEDFRQGRDVLDSLSDAAEHWGAFNSYVSAVLDPVRWEIKRDDQGFAVDFEESNYSAATEKTTLADDQQKLIIDVLRALTVVKTVLLRTKPGPISGAIRSVLRTHDDEAARTDLRGRRDQYVTRLAKIIELGLRKGQVAFANQSLDGFKDYFVSLEADRVKNQYVKLLGMHALVWGVIFFMTWLVLPKVPQLTGFSPYLLLAIGACGGTWLSFSLRRVVLGFGDLALLEDDRMNPTGRILFVVGLTWVVGMLLQTGVIKFSFGDAALKFEGSAPITPMLLIGALCGIAERALAGAVSTRADAFVKSLDAAPNKGAKPP